MPLGVFGLFALVIGINIVIRIIAGSKDRERIRRHLADRGERLVSATWNPFGPGWFGERSDRIYRVNYVDNEGRQRTANCKTSMYSGVYFNDDDLPRTNPQDGASREQDLLEENARLRDELARRDRDHKDG